jgi:hypothetical protein
MGGRGLELELPEDETGSPRENRLGVLWGQGGEADVVEGVVEEVVTVSGQCEVRPQLSPPANKRTSNARQALAALLTAWQQAAAGWHNPSL